ncbi:COP23 domain-containing protein [Chamaesiphon sp. VAR_69_metabat_338]|uniref:COP23 domain-containing protein n=1 Tax=Chamaesiphon sp. VAR_69_metabat_338 TaxID=2964704 RepID=UPI00286E53A4|nr:COP23 domain-containing protein [Chamaesiphon sp. VAR_69_metabat_338]
MNAKFLLLSVALVAPTIATFPTLAQSQHVGFYCGFTQKLEPATMIAIEGNDRGDRSIVVWRHKLNNLSPKQRCDLAAQRFQAAWNRGNFNYLVPGIDNTNGQGLICAVSAKSDVCQTKNMLFAVENAREAQNVSTRLLENMKRPGVGGGTVIYQSSSAQAIDMKDLINSFSK